MCPMKAQTVRACICVCLYRECSVWPFRQRCLACMNHLVTRCHIECLYVCVYVCVRVHYLCMLLYHSPAFIAPLPPLSSTLSLSPSIQIWRSFIGVTGLVRHERVCQGGTVHCHDDIHMIIMPADQTDRKILHCRAEHSVPFLDRFTHQICSFRTYLCSSFMFFLH